jgi:hypothetical protein
MHFMWTSIHQESGLFCSTRKKTGTPDHHLSPLPRQSHSSNAFYAMLIDVEIHMCVVLQGNGVCGLNE